MTAADGSRRGSKPEQRKYPRYGLVLRVEYPDTDEYYSEWTENLSAEGLFVRTERSFDAGDEVEVKLSFPGLLRDVTVRGTVAWVREPSAVQAGGIGLSVGEGANDELVAIAERAQNVAPVERPTPFRILVVEDNPRVTRSYERVLQRLTAGSDDITVDFSANGQAALEQLADNPVDLIITDVYMPVMDGFTFVERLRESKVTAEIPVIVITGGRAGERERAQQVGVSAFLHKPIQFGQLVETIVCLIADDLRSGSE